MTSVIGSSRTAAASLFDTVTQSANLVTQTVNSAGLGMDIIHTKVRTMHAAATQNTDVRIALAKEANLHSLAVSHAETMLDISKRTDRSPELAELYKTTMLKLTSQ